MTKTHLLPTLLIALAITLLLPACKTNEQNYQNAYQQALQNNDTTKAQFNQTIYGRFRQQMRPTPIALGTDTLDARIIPVKIVADQAPEGQTLQPFLIVGGEFKQAFNARSLRQRFIENGYPQAFIVQTGEPYYYVITTTATHASAAMQQLNQLTTHPPFTLRTTPFALRPPQHVR